MTDVYLDSCHVHQNYSYSPRDTLSDCFYRYPLDVVKTRIQLQSSTATGEEAYNSMVDCFRKIVRNEGFSRLYRGIEAPILMEAPKRLVHPARMCPVLTS